MASQVRRQMLVKAHVTVRMAAAFSIMRPETVAGDIPVIEGGALGCLICDLDCEVKAEKDNGIGDQYVLW